MTSPAACYQASTANASVTQPPALVRSVFAAPAPIARSTSPMKISAKTAASTMSVRSEAG